MTGADYMHILPSEDLTELLDKSDYVPMTVFVDANGHQVGDMVVGSKSKEDWMRIIENLLKEVG
jgi:hypothetical protein